MAEELTGAEAARKLKYCAGCRDNFYNGNNGIGVSQCWSLKSAEIVWRWKVDWWSSPPRGPKVRTLSCHYAPGRYAMYKDEPPGNRTRAASAPTQEERRA